MAVNDGDSDEKADAEAWEKGSDGHPHQVYLEACAKLRREVEAELSEAALFAVVEAKRL